MNESIGGPTKEELNRELEALMSLIRHPGWKAFSAVLAQTYTSAEQMMFSSTDQYVGAKCIGVLKCSRDLSTWVEKRIVAIQSYLQSNLE